MQISITNNQRRLKLNTTERRTLERADSILDGVRIVYPDVTREEVLQRTGEDGVMAPTEEKE